MSAAVDLRRAVVAIGERIILDGIDLRIAAGERVAVIGPNGGGKSTLVKLLAGTVAPSHGAATVLGCDAGRPPSGSVLRRHRARIGQVFQGLHPVQRLSVLENVLLGSLSRHRSWLTWARLFPRAEIERAEALLQAVGLIGKAGMRADRLSGGERQKTAIARMLMQEPRLILADEPTAALDPVASADVARLLSSLARRRGITLLTVVHDPGLLPLLAERVIGMRQGRIAFDLPVAALGDDALQRLYRGEAPDGWLERFHRIALSPGERP